MAELTDLAHHRYQVAARPPAQAELLRAEREGRLLRDRRRGRKRAAARRAGRLR